MLFIRRLRRRHSRFFREARAEISRQVASLFRSKFQRCGFQPIIDPRYEMGAFCMNDLEITPAEAKQRLDRGEGVLLVDVPEPWEFEICRIEGAKLIPMGPLPGTLQALDNGDEVICYCHHRMRSLDLAVWLRGQGLERAKSLTAGIVRCSLAIGPRA